MTKRFKKVLPNIYKDIKRKSHVGYHIKKHIIILTKPCH